jgi:hypothetical protein
MEYHGYWYFTNRSAKPIYPTITEDDYEYILNHSGAIYCFVSDAEILQKSKLKIKFLPQRSIFFNPIEGCKTGRNYFSWQRPAIKLMLKLAKA